MATWTPTTKSTGTDEFLKREQNDYLLLEGGGKIVLRYGVDWEAVTKNSSTWSAVAQN